MVRPAVQIDPAVARKQRAITLQQTIQQKQNNTFQSENQRILSEQEQQIQTARQQLSQARAPLQQFKSQYLFPKKRERAFTDRRARSQIVQAGQGVAEQLGQIQQQEQAFEREVATKAPEYALQAQKQQALMEAKQNIQNRINDLQARIQKRQEYILRKQQDRSDKNRREDINDAEDDIDVYNAELREYQKAMGLAETDLIKQHFSGYIKQKAQYEADYREARNRQQADFRKMKLDPKFQDTLKELKLPSNVSLGQFESAVKKYNNDVAYKNQLLKFAEQKGFQNLSPEIQKKMLDTGLVTMTPGSSPTTPSPILTSQTTMQNGIPTTKYYLEQPLEAGMYGPPSRKQILPTRGQGGSMVFNVGQGYEPIVVQKELQIPEKDWSRDVKANKIYQEFMRYSEPIRLTAQGLGLLASTSLGYVFKPFYEAGRKSEDTSIQAKGYRGLLSFGKTAAVFSNPVSGTAGSLYFGGSAVANLAQDPVGFIANTVRYIKQEPFEFVGGLAGARAGKTFSEFALTGTRPKQIIPTAKQIKEVQPFSRQRATLMLKDEKGRYVFGKTKSGEAISIGGKIEKGQTPRTATLAELKQETGLTMKDLSNFKKAKTIVTPEETFYVYTATLKKGSTLKPASDVKSIVTISPNNLFVRGVTGQTALQPVSRIVPFVGRLRAYEAGIMNFLETGKQPTWLSLKTKFGDYILGTQSRYDVAYKFQKQYQRPQDLLLAHGTPQPAILKRYSPFQKKQKVEGSLTQRGQAEGLYVQPPISPKGKGYVGLSYLGFGKSGSGGLGLKVSWPTRTILSFRESPKKLRPTPKTFSGMESEYIIPPQTLIGTAGRAQKAVIGFKRVFVQPSEILIGASSKAIKGRVTSTLSESSQQYRYITPGQIVSPLISYKSKKESYAKTIRQSSNPLIMSPRYSLVQQRSLAVETKKSRERPIREVEREMSKLLYSPQRYPERILYKPQTERSPPYEPPKRPTYFPPLIPSRQNQEQRRRPQQPKPVRRPQRYNILPTITQQIYRVRRKGGRVKRPTGFEMLRI